jgi:CheY-like chemotaxis protein
MKILIAEDSPVSRRMLEAQLVRWGHEVITVSDGFSAWKAMVAQGGPPLFILDWMMPGMDGATLCRKFRESFPGRPAYIILLTALAGHSSLIAGLEAGVDDYITKPFQPDELRARLGAGLRVIALQQALAAKGDELTAALASLRQLREMLPMCSYCKKVRNDEDYWQQVDGYLSENSGARIQPSVCPPCYEKELGPRLGRLRRLCPTRRFHAVAAADSAGAAQPDEKEKVS